MSVPVTEVSKGQDLIRVVVTPKRDFYIPKAATIHPPLSETTDNMILATPTRDLVQSGVSIKSVQETCKLASAELVVPRTL